MCNNVYSTASQNTDDRSPAVTQKKKKKINRYAKQIRNMKAMWWINRSKTQLSLFVNVVFN